MKITEVMATHSYYNIIIACPRCMTFVNDGENKSYIITICQTFKISIGKRCRWNGERVKTLMLLRKVWILWCYFTFTICRVLHRYADAINEYALDKTFSGIFCYWKPECSKGILRFLPHYVQRLYIWGRYISFYNDLCVTIPWKTISAEIRKIAKKSEWEYSELGKEYTWLLAINLSHFVPCWKLEYQGYHFEMCWQKCHKIHYSQDIEIVSILL